MPVTGLCFTEDLITLYGCVDPVGVGREMSGKLPWDKEMCQNRIKPGWIGKRISKQGVSVKASHSWFPRLFQVNILQGKHLWIGKVIPAICSSSSSSVPCHCSGGRKRSSKDWPKLHLLGWALCFFFFPFLQIVSFRVTEGYSFQEISLAWHPPPTSPAATREVCSF